MMFCNTEGGYEGGFQTTDNVVRLSENIGLEDWSNFNAQMTTTDAVPSMSKFNQFSIAPDGITFTPPVGSDMAMTPGFENALMPGGDMSSLLGSMSAMPGGMGLIVSFFQALFSFVSSAMTATAADLAKNYAIAAQATLEGSKTLAR